MQDEGIVALYWKRDETAIQQTQAVYGTQLHTIAYRVLEDHPDSDECVNDVYLRAWNTMPPHRPAGLLGFLSKITRQLAIDRYRRRRAEKRGGGTAYSLSLDELAECVSGRFDPQLEAESNALVGAVNCWLRGLETPVRRAFIRRHFYLDSIEEIAQSLGASPSQVKSRLYRARQGLRAYLEQEGFTV